MTDHPQASFSAIRDKLLRDEDTQQIAKTLGLPIEEYVDQVMVYVENPDKEPELQVLDDAEIEERGGGVPSLQEMRQWLEKVESGEIHVGPHEFKSDFEDDEETFTRKRAVQVTGGSASPPSGEGAPVAPQIEAEPEAGAALKAELLRSRTAGPVRRKGKPGANKPGGKPGAKTDDNKADDK